MNVKITISFFCLLFVSILFSQKIEKQKAAINELMNNWHQAAATADEAVFFDFTMAKDAVYIGTDASELWTREEMKIWAKDIFQRDKAWDFKVKSRNIYFSKNKKVVWFDELLETWMGICRSSGVLEKEKGRWKLKHYHLSVAVPNEVIKDYLKLIESKE